MAKANSLKDTLQFVRKAITALDALYQPGGKVTNRGPEVAKIVNALEMKLDIFERFELEKYAKVKK